MGSMAEEMKARMEADGGAGLPDGGGDGAVVPGNAGDPPNRAASSAETSNTETAAGSGTPETIPYPRFKEVNDRLNELKPVEELFQFGYDADSLRRLASFEASYLQDPIGTLANMAENLDLPQDTIDAIKAHVYSEGGNGRAEGEPVSDGASASSLPPEVQARLEYVDQLRAREDEALRQANLDSVVSAWDKLDKEENIKSPPERIKLMAIAATAQSGQQFRTYDDFARAARESIIEYREDVLGSAIQTGRQGTSPPALPSSAAHASGPVKFGNIREASRAAEEAIKRGDLPPVSD